MTNFIWQRSALDFKEATKMNIDCDKDPCKHYYEVDGVLLDDYKPFWSLAIRADSDDNRLVQTISIELTQEQLEQLHFKLGVSLIEAAIEKGKSNE